MQDKIIINDYIENDPLSDKNLDNTLETIHEFRLSCPNKSIWLYTGYEVDIKNYTYVDASDNYELKTQYSFIATQPSKDTRINFIRASIINNVDVLVDGRYINSRCNPSKKWAGSDNQRVISIQESLKQGKIVLWCE